MAGVSDEVFARYINEIGNATLEQIEAAQREQVIRARAGTPTALADVLVEQGVLTPAIRENIEKKLIAQQEGGLRQLGNYKLLKKLGEGGMGTVYLAEDTLAGRKVALKVLPKKHAGDSEFLTRFRREAKATGKLNHVNIVSAFSVGEELGNHFYAMEYCEGEPLDAKQKREQVLEWDKAIEIITQVARGLKHAHEHGFIHRDIKPANIFYTSEGVAKILDLGLSKNILDAEQSFNTQTGVAMGTPHYISPEQARGEKTIDGRTDIYSLGATLYHLVTGQTPFQGSTAAMIMMKHLNDQLPNPQDIRENIPDSVVHVIQKMMAKDAKDRYADCAELLTDLELVIDGKSPSSLALDVGKSSIAMPRARKADVVAAADHMRAARKGGTNRHEPVAGRGDRRSEKSDAAPKKNQKPLLIGGGVAVVGALILIVALMKGGGNPPAQGTDKAVTETRINTTVPTPPPDPGSATPTASAQPLPVNAGNLRPGLWATYWTGSEDNWFQRFQFGQVETKLTKKWIGKPDQRLKADYYAVRWVGMIRITEANSYRFSANSDGKFRVLFDGKEVGEAPRGALGVKLQPGDYPVLIEFFDNGGPMSTTVRWTYAGITGWHDLPPENLFHLPEQESATQVAVTGVEDAWIKTVQALPAAEQLKKVIEKLRELNPQYDGVHHAAYQGNKVSDMSILNAPVSDISPLRSLSLTGLKLNNLPLVDISPLKGMPLRHLELNSTQVRDLSALQGLPLLRLSLQNAAVQDMSQIATLNLQELNFTPSPQMNGLDAVRAMKTLKTINGMPAAEFRAKNSAPATAGGASTDWIKTVQAVPPEKQSEAIVAKLKELNPGYDGSLRKQKIENGKLVALEFDKPTITNISPLAAAADLQYLILYNANVTDLSPLRGLNLAGIWMDNAKVSDVSPLADLRTLEYLCINATQVRDLTPLKSLKLKYLNCNYTNVSSLAPLQESKLEELYITKTKVTDLSPIANMPLKTIELSFEPARDSAVLQSIKTLEKINNQPAAEFWKKDPLSAPSVKALAPSVLVSESFEKFDQGKLPAGWWLLNKAPAVLVDQPGRGKVLRARREEGLAVTLDPAVVNGHTLRISAMAYCPLGYAKLNDWAKPRLLLKVDNNEDSAKAVEPDQRNWKQLLIPSWKIPADAKVVRVYLTVPLVQAEVFFDDLLIEMDPDPKSAPPPQ